MKGRLETIAQICAMTTSAIPALALSQFRLRVILAITGDVLKIFCSRVFSSRVVTCRWRDLDNEAAVPALPLSN
jgi:hypothetical protein